MNQQRRKQFGSAGNLTIRGSDNTPCHRLQNALSPGTSLSRSAARRTTSTSATTTTLRKTGSFGNVQTEATFSIPSTKVTSKGITVCPCHQNESAAQLKEQYTRNLQQQVYLLELENNYLKHGAGKICHKNDENDSYQSAASPSPSPSALLETSVGQLTANGLLKYDKEKPTKTRKKVSYAEPEVMVAAGPSNSQDKKSLLFASGQAELLQKLEESYQRERKLEERLKQKTIEIERIVYENKQLSERIEELESKLLKTEENFARDKRALMEEAVELQRRLDYLTPALADKESHIAKLETEKDDLADKLRNSTNLLNELKIKVDKENREEKALSNVEGERKIEVDHLFKTIRRLENVVEELKNKEASLIDDLAAMKRSLREEQLTAKKDKAVAEKTLEENSSLIKENSILSAQLSRMEMKMKTLIQEIDNARENEIKPEEIAKLREAEESLKTELLKMEEKLQTEKERYRRTSTELEQYQKAESEGRECRARMQKELDALKTLSESLSNENKSLRQEKIILDERCEELLRKGNLLADEVTNLTSDVHSLKIANSDLQQQIDGKSKEISAQSEELKIVLEQNRKIVKNLEDQENDLQMWKERCENAEKKYTEMNEQLQMQTTMQQAKTEEYEELAKRVLELSDSVKLGRTPTLPNQTTHHQFAPSTLQSDHSTEQSPSRRASSAIIQRTTGHVHITQRRRMS